MILGRQLLDDINLFIEVLEHLDKVPRPKGIIIVEQLVAFYKARAFLDPIYTTHYDQLCKYLGELEDVLERLLEQCIDDPIGARDALFELIKKAANNHDVEGVNLLSSIFSTAKAIEEGKRFGATMRPIIREYLDVFVTMVAAAPHLRELRNCLAPFVSGMRRAFHCAIPSKLGTSRQSTLSLLLTFPKYLQTRMHQATPIPIRSTIL